MKKIILFLILFLFFFLKLNISRAVDDNLIIKGELNLSVESKNKLKEYNNIPFYSNSQWVRLEISDKVYYIVNISSEKAFVVNKKRNTVSQTNFKNLIEFESPSLKIFQNKDILKNFLSDNKASLLKEYKLNNTPYQNWSFNVKGNNYYVSIKLPEFLICNLQIKMPRKTIFVSVNKLKTIARVDNSYFAIPQKFTIIKLGK